MSKRGPAPTPRTILEQRGSWRAKLNRDQPVPKAGRPKCPKLSKAEKTVWNAIMRILDDMGVGSLKVCWGYKHPLPGKPAQRANLVYMFVCNSRTKTSRLPIVLGCSDA